MSDQVETSGVSSDDKLWAALSYVFSPLRSRHSSSDGREKETTIHQVSCRSVPCCWNRAVHRCTDHRYLDAMYRFCSLACYVLLGL